MQQESSQVVGIRTHKAVDVTFKTASVGFWIFGYGLSSTATCTCQCVNVACCVMEQSRAGFRPDDRTSKSPLSTTARIVDGGILMRSVLNDSCGLGSN